MASWRKKGIIAAGILAVALLIYMESQKSHYSVAQISANPGLIDGKTVSGLLVDLHLKDVTLRGTTFKKAQLYGAVFENVIFDDCTFSDTLLWEATFKDVLFKNGVFVRKAGDENYEVRSGVIASWLYNVTFNATKFINFDFDGIGGSIRFLNITQVSGYKSAAAMGGARDVECNIEVRDCNIKDYLLLVLGNRAKAYITNSTFTGSGVGGSGGAVLYAKNCSYAGGSSVAKADTVVVIDSALKGTSLGAQKNAYFVNNTYTYSGPHHDYCGTFGPEANFYFLNKERQRAKINLMGGNFFVQNMELVESSIQPWRKDVDPPLGWLNLKDVTICGGDWVNLKLKSGQWENVQIYPTVDITGSTIENVQGYNVTFPEGTPWKGKSAGGASMTLSKTPFEWPEVHVPTPEELGLIWEWPEVTGAPAP